MGVRLNASKEAIDRWFEKLEKELSEQITLQFSILGTECVNRIRQRSAEESWIDRTGNLRSSIGMAVYDHGVEVIRSAFEVVGEGSEGSGEGQDYISALANRFSDVYGLAVVAAMDYASYVEAKPDKWVLEKEEAYANEQLEGCIQQAIENTMARMGNVPFD